ncbi:MAG: aldose epimerase family protein [Bacteroidota bacterium]|nr:aldose epimerase family protein [Bacteroidota bacterium]
MNNFKTITLIILFIELNVSCKYQKEKNSFNSPVSVQKAFYGVTKDNQDVYQFSLRNKNGMEINIITYGGIITKWKAKDKFNHFNDIVLGFNSLSRYESSSPYFGAIVGRYGNRISKGKFKLNNKDYFLTTNDNKNHLHGGLKGFDKVIWEAQIINYDSIPSLELKYLSEDMEEGYPGNLETKVIYTLNNMDELTVNYEAKTDKTTIVNLTQHSYFNLSGNFNNDILSHELVINADSFIPVDTSLIPIGEIRKVEGTPFDFKKRKKIGKEINYENQQIKNGKGYDHCWVLNDQENDLRFVASVYEEKSGRFLEIFSTEPGVQFYSGNFLDGTLKSKTNGTYNFRSGFCLETQHYPDSPNQPKFPSVVLLPGDIYNSKTIYRLSNK